MREYSFVYLASTGREPLLYFILASTFFLCTLKLCFTFSLSSPVYRYASSYVSSISMTSSSCSSSHDKFVSLSSSLFYLVCFLIFIALASFCLCGGIIFSSMSFICSFICNRISFITAEISSLKYT